MPLTHERITGSYKYICLFFFFQPSLYVIFHSKETKLVVKKTAMKIVAFLTYSDCPRQLRLAGGLACSLQFWSVQSKIATVDANIFSKIFIFERSHPSVSTRQPIIIETLFNTYNCTISKTSSGNHFASS